MMISRHRVFSLALLLVFTLLLASCVRPFSQSTNTQTNDTTTDETTSDEATTNDTAPADLSDTGTSTDEMDNNTSEETSAANPGAVETAVPTTESDTPRVEETQPMETATPIPETAEETASEETAVSDTNTPEETTATTEPTTETPAEETTAPTSEMPDTHTVATGENLYRIGLEYGVSWVTLAEINGLSNPNAIKIGQVIKLPGTNNAATEPTPESTPSPATETTYTVQTGDNLFRIGLKYGLSWVQIAEANGIVNPNQIVAGQVIKIPVNAPGPTPQFMHVVKQGETLFTISLQYGIAWPGIAEANQLDSPYLIYAGQTLVIPGG